jgi:signal transduction histidine kinase
VRVATSDRSDPGEALRARFSAPEVFNTICHDVRAALSVTSGSAFELASGDHGLLNETQTQFLGMIQRGNLRLSRLAGNLMVLSDLWDGTLTLRLARIDASRLVVELVDELRRADPASRVEVAVKCPPAPVEATLDPEGLRLALANLVGTAMGVAQRRVVVDLTVQPSGLELTIEDDGPERRPSAGGELKRVSSAELALAVCDGLVRAHGGELRTETPLGPKGGFRAILRLPTPSNGA